MMGTEFRVAHNAKSLLVASSSKYNQVALDENTSDIQWQYGQKVNLSASFLNSSSLCNFLRMFSRISGTDMQDLLLSLVWIAMKSTMLISTSLKRTVLGNHDIIQLQILMKQRKVHQRMLEIFCDKSSSECSTSRLLYIYWHWQVYKCIKTKQEYSHTLKSMKRMVTRVVL